MIHLVLGKKFGRGKGIVLRLNNLISDSGYIWIASDLSSDIRDMNQRTRRKGSHIKDGRCEEKAEEITLTWGKLVRNKEQVWSLNSEHMAAEERALDPIPVRDLTSNKSTVWIEGTNRKHGRAAPNFTRKNLDVGWTLVGMNTLHSF